MACGQWGKHVATVDLAGLFHHAGRRCRMRSCQTAAAATVQPASVSTGTILSMRAVAARASQDPLRSAMLPAGASPNYGVRSLMEFIVRTDDGATLSIVQTNEPGFRTGDRVVIMRDDLTHLARPNPQAGS